MDEEKFQRLLMDELYDELDPDTSAAMKRWAAAHPEAAGTLASLQATRKATAESYVPVTPPEDLEWRILAAARSAHAVLPFRRRAALAVSRAGSWAMRPQTAMAAVFLVMIGSSVLLLNGKYTGRTKDGYTVSEQGSPAAAAATAEEAKPFDPATADLAHGMEAKAAATTNALALNEPTPLPAASALELLDPSREPREPGSQDTPRRKAPQGGRPAGPSKEDDALLAMDQAASGPYEARDEAPKGRGWAPAPRAAPLSRPPVAQAGAGATGSSNAGAIGGAGLQAASGTASPKDKAESAPAADGKKGAPSDDFERGMASYRGHNYTDATSTWDALANRTGDLTAELWAARSVRDGRGCAAALPRFESLASRAFPTVAGQEATLDAGRCHKSLGDQAAARQRFTRLLTVPYLMASAQRELDALAPPAKAAVKPAQKQKSAAESL